MQKAYKNVAVLMGGRSAEREISLKSGKAVLQALHRQGVSAQPVDVDDNIVKVIEKVEADIVFIALHGRGGEDGTIQGLLELLDIPYTGSGVMGSAIGMDKLRCKMLWGGAGIPTPHYKVLNQSSKILEVCSAMNYPLMIKPVSEGSSIGMAKVLSADKLEAAVKIAHNYDSCVMAEEWVDGQEFTAAILGDEVLPIIRLETPESFYDYEAKYTLNTTKYYCPCGFTEEVNRNISELALKAFKDIGAEGWGRVDFMLTEDGDPLFLEINTSPGMTDHSLVPMAAAAADMSFDQLVMKILDFGWNRFRQGTVNV